MSNQADKITHPGIVKEVQRDTMLVKVLSKSACAHCHIKGMCSIADMEEKIIEVKKNKDKQYSTGDEVLVTMEKSLGPKAVILGYLIPFIIVLAALIILITVTGREGFSALISLGLLVPYYIIIYRLRDRFKKTFMFKVE